MLKTVSEIEKQYVGSINFVGIDEMKKAVNEETKKLFDELPTEWKMEGGRKNKTRKKRKTRRKKRRKRKRKSRRKYKKSRKNRRKKGGNILSLTNFPLYITVKY